MTSLKTTIDALPAGGVPLVTIGMPIYNGEEYLETALQSVLGQDYPNLEILVSDNASTDKSWQILGDYAAKDRRLVLHRQTNNIELIPNFRLVLDRAKGEYFVWAAHDDFRYVNYVSALVAPLVDDPRLAMSCPQVAKVDITGKPKTVLDFPECLSGPRVSRIRKMLDAAQSAWVFGLYRTKALRPVFERSTRTNLVFGFDHLIILHFLLNDELGGSNQTRLFLRKTYRSAPIYAPKGPFGRIRLAKRFGRETASILAGTSLDVMERARLALPLARYVNSKVAHVVDFHKYRHVSALHRAVRGRTGGLNHRSTGG